MTNNVYAAPRSNLDEQPCNDVVDRFYIVAPRKMLILFFMTVGMYQVYWYFANWARHKDATGNSVWPVPRAIFSIFFIHSLFHNISDYDATGKRGQWDSGSYAAALVFLQAVGYVLAWTGQGSKIFDLLSISLIIPTGLLLKQVQLEVNARCGDPAGAGNQSFTVANYIWCGIGAIFWLLLLIGMALPRDVA